MNRRHPVRAALWLRWWAIRAARALGFPGLLAAVLLLAAIALLGIVRALWTSDVERLAAGVDAVQREAAGRRAAAVAANGDGSAESVLQSLPTLSTVSQLDALVALQASARAAQLDVEGGSYRTEKPDGVPVARLDIVLQARGTYPQLRSFAVRALQADSALALNTMRLSRSHAGEGAVSAEFNFSLFLRTP